MGVRVPVGTVVSVTVPVGADDGTAVLTDEVAVDGLVVVTVTTEVSVEVPWLPHAVVSPPEATITARAVTADNGRPAFMSSRYPIRKRGTPRNQCGLALNHCRRRLASLVRGAGNNAPWSGRTGTARPMSGSAINREIRRLTRRTWGGLPWSTRHVRQRNVQGSTDLRP